MLYQLGALSITVAPFNVDKVQMSSSTDYAAKPVIGTMPPLEYVGEGATTWRLSGTLFPKVIGGMSQLAILHQMRERGQPQFLQRGDGAPMGWVVIEKVMERSSHLAADGVGRKVDVTIHLKKSGRPSKLALFTILAGFFQ